MIHHGNNGDNQWVWRPQFFILHENRQWCLDWGVLHLGTQSSHLSPHYLPTSTLQRCTGLSWQRHKQTNWQSCRQHSWDIPPAADWWLVVVYYSMFPQLTVTRIYSIQCPHLGWHECFEWAVSGCRGNYVSTYLCQQENYLPPPPGLSWIFMNCTITHMVKL